MKSRSQRYVVRLDSKCLPRYKEIVRSTHATYLKASIRVDLVVETTLFPLSRRIIGAPEQTSLS
jgi:hypothetical protein